MTKKAKDDPAARRGPAVTAKPKGDPLARTEKALRKLALGYPETHEDFPWGECAFKVKKKVFLFMSMGKKGLSLSMKLPKSGAAALMFPFAEPTHYGLGKSGWVSSSFSDRQTPPLDLLCEWTDESYRAIAPKKLVAGLAGKGVTSAAAGSSIGPRKSGVPRTSGKTGVRGKSEGSRKTDKTSGRGTSGRSR